MLFIFSFIFIGVLSQLEKEESLQYLQNIKSQTENRLKLLEQEWKIKSQSKSIAICLFKDMLIDQQTECNQRGSTSQQINYQIETSKELIESYNKRLTRNSQRKQALETIKCQSNVNSIKLLKDQKSITQLSIQMQRSFQQSNSKMLVEMIDQDNFFEQELETEELPIDIQIENETINLELEYPSKEKQAEQNKQKILDISQNIQKTVPLDSQLMQKNQIKSTQQIDKYLFQLNRENDILNENIKNELEKINDLNDLFIGYSGNDQDCTDIMKNIQLLQNLAQSGFDQEYVENLFEINIQKMKLQVLLDEYEFNEKPLLEAIADSQTMRQFLDYIVKWEQADEMKYPYFVSDLIFTSYDIVLSLFFTVQLENDMLAIQYLMTFLENEQNETSCGYFEKCLKPLLLLKSNEIRQYINLERFMPLIHFESIQNIFMTILKCGHYEDEYKIQLLNLLGNNLSDDVTRIMIAEEIILKEWCAQCPQIVDKIFQLPFQMNTLLLIEQLTHWNIYNLQWFEKAMKVLQTDNSVNQISQEKICNFLSNLPTFGELRLEIVKIFTFTIQLEATKQFQNILLDLLLQYEWNNQLQNIANNMYKMMAARESVHSIYFRSFIKEFINSRVSFQKHDLNLKVQVTHGYQWLFTRIIRMFDIYDNEIVNEIIRVEDTHLLEWDPSNQKGRSSFCILDQINKRLLSWTNRQSDDQKVEEEPESEEVFQGRNSFGYKQSSGMEDEQQQESKQQQEQEDQEKQEQEQQQQQYQYQYQQPEEESQEQQQLQQQQPEEES